MNKLVKLSDTHYIIVDNSEIKEGDWYIDDVNNIRRSITSDKGYWVSRKDYKKITRSTRPLSEECIRCNGYCEQCVDSTKPLSLSKVEEAVYGYSVEEMAFEAMIDYKPFEEAEGYKDYARYGFHKGFNAHQKLVKDKLFTVEDMEDAFRQGTNIGACYESFDSEDSKEAEEYSEIEFNDFKQSLLPPTEWDVEFVEDKLKLI